MRIDVLLVERGYTNSRTQAQELIAAGRITVISAKGREVVRKASQNIEPDEILNIEVQFGEEQLFVSRGGLKLNGALAHLKLQIQDFLVMDLGISTGGFTDCLLQAGAKKVIGIDVGHGQLADKLKNDERVHLLEGINARQLPAEVIWHTTAGQKFDLLVVDVSFISLTLVLAPALAFLRDSGLVLALVKPQFEVGKQGLGKGGIVKDPGRFAEVKEKIRHFSEQQNLIVRDYFASSIDGSDGNQEFFIFAQKGHV